MILDKNLTVDHLMEIDETVGLIYKFIFFLLRA